MQIVGAVLNEIGAARPFSQSAPISVDELELAPPEANEILVRVEVAGLCHSDLSVVDGNRVRPTPMLLGHEAAGRVEVLGSDVHDLRVGQRVVMTFLPRCGHCDDCLTDGMAPCTSGTAANTAGTLIGGGRRISRNGVAVNHHLGVSAFATHAVVSRRSVVPVESDVPPTVAALLGCAVLTGGGAILNVGRPRAGQRVVVVGLGGIGMAAVLTALSIDGVEVVAIDTSPEKLATAERLGAHSVYTPAEANQEAVHAPIVIEAAGNVAAFESALALTSIGGQMITVGLPAPDAYASVAPLRLVSGGLSIRGSYLGSSVPARDIPRLVGLWRSGRLPVEQLISKTIGLSDVNTGMDELASGASLRQIIDLQHRV